MPIGRNFISMPATARANRGLHRNGGGSSPIPNSAWTIQLASGRPQIKQLSLAPNLHSTIRRRSNSENGFALNSRMQFKLILTEDIIPQPIQISVLTTYLAMTQSIRFAVLAPKCLRHRNQQSLNCRFGCAQTRMT